MSINSNIFLVFIMLIMSNSFSQAQKVKYDNDTVKVDGKPYAIMKKRNAGILMNDFIVSSLSGTELLYFKAKLRYWSGSGFKYSNSEELYFEANFIATGNKAELKHYYGNGFAKLIVDNNLIKNNAIDPVSENRFIQLYNGTFLLPVNTNTSDNSPAVVVNINNNNGNGGSENASNSSAPKITKSKSPIIINGNKILRDENIIGKFREDTTTSTYSQKSRLITIYSEAGEKVAEASVPILNSQEWFIKILIENKTYNILYDSPNERENLFKWLADKNYLKN